MKALDMNELNQVNGGLITTYGGCYWAVCDEGDEFCYIYGGYDWAAQMCDRNNWSKRLVSPEEFKEEFGYSFYPGPDWEDPWSDM